MRSEVNKTADLKWHSSCFDVLKAEKGSSSKITRLISSYQGAPKNVLADTNVWGAEFYGLDKSSYFSNLSEEKQIEILTRCGHAILVESQMIEVAGIAYTAKMALLSTTLEQRTLYSLFAADEARHLEYFTALIGKPEFSAQVHNSFLGFLDRLIVTEEPMILVLLIQVLLEGWGIRHYSSLARDSLNSEVTDGFKSILLDEGKHHGSGLLLFNESELSAVEMRRLKAWVGDFIAMVRLGPLSLVNHLSQVTGGISSKHIYTLLEEIKFEEKITADLKLMANLLIMCGAGQTYRDFESLNVFSVPTISECHAQISSALGVLV